MAVTISGTGRIRSIGFDNYNGSAVYIVAWKKNTYASDGSVAAIQTRVKYKTEVEEAVITLPEPVWYFSCAIKYPYMVYVYSNGSATIGSVTKTTLNIINIKTGTKGEFSNAGLLMMTDGVPDVTFEGLERWKMLTACAIISQKKNLGGV